MSCLDALPSHPHGYEEIRPHELARCADTVQLLDVRSPEEFHGELGHIEGAELVPLHDLAAQLSRFDTDRALVLVCRSGRRSAAACQLLLDRGFVRPINLRGGMMAWREMEAS